MLKLVILILKYTSTLPYVTIQKQLSWSIYYTFALVVLIVYVT